MNSTDNKVILAVDMGTAAGRQDLSAQCHCLIALPGAWILYGDTFNKSRPGKTGIRSNKSAISDCIVEIE